VCPSRAIPAFGRTFAKEPTPGGIRVNTISPGPIDAPIPDKNGFTPEQKRGFLDGAKTRIPLARAGASDEAAADRGDPSSSHSAALLFAPWALPSPARGEGYSPLAPSPIPSYSVPHTPPPSREPLHAQPNPCDRRGDDHRG